MNIAKKVILFLLTFSFYSFTFTNSAISASKEEDNDSLIEQILESAHQDEAKGSSEGFWQAARHYCRASKLGSSEAQYRLGMLYAYGKGVPADREFASSLFSIASNQGHDEAGNMLETIQFSGQKLPPCVEINQDPDHNYETSEYTDEHINRYLNKLPSNKRWLLDLIKSTADWYKIDPNIVISIVAIESNFNQNAKSKANAMGLMQLIPQTADRFNVRDAFNASQNIKGGVKYLRWLIDYYAGDLDLAVAAYNAGEKAVDKYRGIPPFQETKDYVKKFRQLYAKRNHSYNDQASISPLKK